MEKLLERLPDGAVLLDDQGRIRCCNRTARVLLGEFGFTEILRRIADSDSASPCFVTKPGAEGSAAVCEVRTETLEWNDELLRLVTLHPGADAGGALAGEAATASGWTAFLDAVEEMVLIVDPDGEVRHANRAARDGFDSEQMAAAARSWKELVRGWMEPPQGAVGRTRIPNSPCRVAAATDPGSGCTLSVTVCRLDGSELRPASEPLFAVLIQDETRRSRHEREAHRLNLALARSFSGITRALSDLVEGRDPYTVGHSGSVAALAARIAEEMRLSEDEIEGLRVSGLLHDIGKASVPSSILNKPGRLSPYEWGMLKEHPAKAYEALRHIPFPWPVAEVVYQHHERLDGSGYPRGLKGDELHLWARILAVADVVDAMSKHRPYRPRLPLKLVLEEIRGGRGQLYDERVVDAYLELLRRESNRVMVVDDEPLMLDFVTEVLEMEGLEVSGFRDPLAALEAFKASAYPLMVTDLKMPNMDGFELIKKVRAISPDTEVIVITGSGDKHGAVEALRLGARDFLEKPMEIGMLQNAVQEALSHYRGWV